MDKKKLFTVKPYKKEFFKDFSIIFYSDNGTNIPIVVGYNDMVEEFLDDMVAFMNKHNLDKLMCEDETVIREYFDLIASFNAVSKL